MSDGAAAAAATTEGAWKVESSATADKEDSSNDKKREHEGSGTNNMKKNKKKMTSHTWRREGDNPYKGEQRAGGSKTEVHKGSYADPAMRELFGVVIPPHLLPPDASSQDDAAAKNTTGEDDSNQGKRKFSKKKVAFLLAYLGSGYAGFQTNEGQRTLQAEFELALLKSELLSPLNFGYGHKYSWSTSGRTDKGVHACAQVCSAKIQMLPDQTTDDVRELINQHLPAEFRVLDVVRATRSFCAKTGRSKVRYQYMIPSFCFFDRKQLIEMMKEVAPVEGRDGCAGSPLTDSEVRTFQEKLKSYRVTPEQLGSLQTALRQYEGTHSFHNFTKGLSAKDANATRYIVSFNVEKPMVFENGMEWVPTQVVGQSFLLHQIRKMISVGLDSVRMGMPDMINSALDKSNRVVTNVAPAQGLFLEMSFYDGYNQGKAAHHDIDELDWATEGTPENDRWKKFRNEVIMEHVVKEEATEGNFIQYLYNQEFYLEQRQNYESLASNRNTTEDSKETE